MTKNFLRLAAALFFALFALPAIAQQTAAHSVPIGRGPGVSGFNAALSGTAGQLLIDQGSGADPAFKPLSGGCTVTSAGVITCSGSPIAIGTTPVTGGTPGKVLYDNAGSVGELTVSGSGNVCLTTSCVLVTPTLGAASGTSLNLSGLTASSAVATDASKNLVSVTNTGTGNNVLANSPTLVTPALGTPSALVLTNATGLPVGSGISGLGTGIAAWLATPTSANLATALTDETGSGAAVFGTSPTLTTPALGTPSVLVGTNITGTGSGFTAGTANALSSSGFANPSGTSGLTAVNGSATSAMRSDAAPPISQAIIPTWTGKHTFNGGIVSGGMPLTYVPTNSAVTTNGALNLQGTSTTTNQNIVLNAEIASNTQCNQGCLAGQFGNTLSSTAGNGWGVVSGIGINPSWSTTSFSAFTTEFDINNLSAHFGNNLSTGNSAAILMNGIGYRNTTAVLISTATTGVLTATVNAGGSNYAVGNTITLTCTPGTVGDSPIVTVATISGSAVATATVTTPGFYVGSVPTACTQASTSASGSGATFTITTGTVPVWNNGIYLNAHSVLTDAIHDGTSAVNSYDDVGIHTTGINLGGTYSSYALKLGSNFAIDPSGNIARGTATFVAGQAVNLSGNISNPGGNTIGVLVNATHFPTGGGAAVGMQNNVLVSVTSPNVDTAYGYYGSAITKTGTGSIGTAYGAFFENQTIGTSANWSIWSAGNAHFDKSIFSGAGTATVAPIVLAAGTNLTTPTAGAIEYDGTSLYCTTAASSRQVCDTEQVTVLSADNTAPTNVATAQNVFPTGQGTLTVQAGTTYEYEAFYWITRSAGTTSHTTSVLYGGTATLTDLKFLAVTANPTGNVLGATSAIIGGTSGAIVTAANTSATENVMVHQRGTFRVNAGGTIIPQFQYSAAPGGAPTVKAESFFRMWPIGSNTVTQVGNWS